MEQRLIEVFKRVLKVHSIDYAISQENCELWDSITHISLMVEIESEFNVAFLPEEIQEMKDFSKIINQLQKVI